MSVVIELPDFSGSDFKLMDEGTHQVFVSEVKDLGEWPIPKQFQQEDGPTTRRRIVIRFATADGTDVSKFYTPSIHEMATLAKDLKSIGKDPSSLLELKDGKRVLNFDRLIGTPCQVVVTHSEKEGKVYANIAAFLKPAKGQTAPKATNVGW